MSLLSASMAWALPGAAALLALLAAAVAAWRARRRHRQRYAALEALLARVQEGRAARIAKTAEDLETRLGLSQAAALEVAESAAAAERDFLKSILQPMLSNPQELPGDLDQWLYTFADRQRDALLAVAVSERLPAAPDSDLLSLDADDEVAHADHLEWRDAWSEDAELASTESSQIADDADPALLAETPAEDVPEMTPLTDPDLGGLIDNGYENPVLSLEAEQSEGSHVDALDEPRLLPEDEAAEFATEQPSEEIEPTSDDLESWAAVDPVASVIEDEAQEDEADFAPQELPAIGTLEAASEPLTGPEDADSRESPHEILSSLASEPEPALAAVPDDSLLPSEDDSDLALEPDEVVPAGESAADSTGVSDNEPEAVGADAETSPPGKDPFASLDAELESLLRGPWGVSEAEPERSPSASEDGSEPLTPEAAADEPENLMALTPEPEAPATEPPLHLAGSLDSLLSGPWDDDEADAPTDADVHQLEIEEVPDEATIETGETIKPIALHDELATPGPEVRHSPSEEPEMAEGIGAPDSTLQNHGDISAAAPPAPEGERSGDSAAITAVRDLDQELKETAPITPAAKQRKPRASKPRGKKKKSPECADSAGGPE